MRKQLLRAIEDAARQLLPATAHLVARLLARPVAVLGIKRHCEEVQVVAAAQHGTQPPHAAQAVGLSEPTVQGQALMILVLHLLAPCVEMLLRGMTPRLFPGLAGAAARPQMT